RSWSRGPPRGLFALADYERAAMWILRRLNEIEAEAAAPSALIGPLHRHVENALARNEHLDAEAARIITLLEDARHDVVLIKGLARRAGAALFPCGDAHTLTNVDLLVAPGRLDTAFQVLLGAGYRATSDAAE